jgi:hypothetical protein
MYVTTIRREDLKKVILMEMKPEDIAERIHELEQEFYLR